MEDRRLCNKCGLLPQKGVKPQPPCRPKCKKKCCCKKNCCEDDFVFRKTVVPVSLGDDITGKEKAVNGAFVNALVVYEANGAVYLFDSYGVPTRIVEGE